MDISYDFLFGYLALLFRLYEYCPGLKTCVVLAVMWQTLFNLFFSFLKENKRENDCKLKCIANQKPTFLVVFSLQNPIRFRIKFCQEFTILDNTLYCIYIFLNNHLHTLWTYLSIVHCHCTIDVILRAMSRKETVAFVIKFSSSSHSPLYPHNARELANWTEQIHTVHGNISDKACDKRLIT